MFSFYLEGFYNYMTTGSVLSKYERIMYSLCSYIFDNVKCKNIYLNHLENISFETINRTYILEYDAEDKVFILNYYTKPKGMRYENLDESIYFNSFNDLEKWFRKRNYLK